MQQSTVPKPVENIPMTEQQTDANWRQVHPGGERKEMSQKIQNEQRWSHSHKTQKEQRWDQSFNEEESSQKRLSKDGFQAAGVPSTPVKLVQSLTFLVQSICQWQKFKSHSLCQLVSRLVGIYFEEMPAIFNINIETMPAKVGERIISNIFILKKCQQIKQIA